MNKLELQKLRLINNGLIIPFSNVDECVQKLHGIQCQYQNYALISIMNRIKNYNNDEIYKNENLIKSWGQRTTLHIYHKNDYDLISNLYAETPNWVKKYSNYLGIDYNEYLKKISEVIEDKMVLTKKEIETIIPNYKSKEIMQWSGLLILATYEKVLYGILNENDNKLYKKNDIVSKDSTKESFIIDYFNYYGPATSSDFLHWAGLRKVDIKELDELLAKMNYILIDNKKYYYITLPNIDDYQFDHPIVLGKFDPLLVSYSDKEWILGNFDKNVIWKAAGQIEGIIVNEHGLMATWHYKIIGNEILYVIKCLKKISNKEKKILENKFKRYNLILNKENSRIVYE